MSSAPDYPELGTGLTVVNDLRLVLGEGPLWDHGRGELVFVDSHEGAIFRLDVSTGAVATIAVGTQIGIAIPRAAGGYAVSSVAGLLGVSIDGQVEMLAAIEPDVPGNRMNDAQCDRRGRIFSGTFAMQIQRGAGSLYRIDPDHSVLRMADGISVSNGMGWSPDSRLFYFIDTSARGVDAFDYDLETGAIANRRRLIDIPREHGFADGMAVDEDGCLWVAHYTGGAVRRYSPSGEPIGQITLPVSGVTSCCFGGPDLADLYITTACFGVAEERLAHEPLAGALFRCRPGVRGLRSTAYAG